MNTELSNNSKLLAKACRVILEHKAQEFKDAFALCGNERQETAVAFFNKLGLDSETVEKHLGVSIAEIIQHDEKPKPIPITEDEKVYLCDKLGLESSQVATFTKPPPKRTVSAEDRQWLFEKMGICL